MDHPKRELKYVAAKKLNGQPATLEGSDVYGSDGGKLGTIEGFIVDVQQGLPRHLVVAAGWFIHKHFLLPIGHVTLRADGNGVMADVTQERVKSFPGFDKDEFEKLNEHEIETLDRTMASVTAGSPVTNLDDHYRLPAGWN